MSAASRYWVIVPAAGVGKRMGASIPKQYLTLLGQTVIEHTIQRLLLHPLIDTIHIVLDAQDQWWKKTKYAKNPQLVCVVGGSERYYSVLNALDALVDCAHPDDWVLVHDAARPCIHQTDIDHLIQQVKQSKAGGLLGLPVCDTMKKTNAENQVIQTITRHQMWRALTPQMFRFAYLRQALRDAIEKGCRVTDEASAIEWAGGTPLMVEGRSDNLKITRPDDLGLAALFLQAPL